MKELFSSCKFNQYAYATELYLVKTLEKFNPGKYIVYGAGNNIRAVINYLVRTQNIHIDYIVDQNPSQTDIEGISVISCEKFSVLSKGAENRWYAFVSIGEYGNNKEITEDIERYLYSVGILKIIKIDSQVNAITKMDWYAFFMDNQELFCGMIDLFADELSKETYYEYIRAYLEGHAYQGKTLPEENKYFMFDEDVIEHLENEVWINFGAYYGDTICHYINQKDNFDQIYAVEGDTETAKKLENNISLLPENIQNRIEIVKQYFSKEENSLDNYFKDQRITYVNMDIEGAERDVLQSGKRCIQRNRPVLAICVYHCKDDLIVIPDIISKMVDQYSFYLRKYPSLIGGYYNGYFQLNELVLYAVPNERIKKSIV